MFQRRIPLVRLLGFEIRFDLTWLIVVALIVWTLSVGYFPAAYADLPAATYVWMGIVGAAGLFASIVLHELAHSVVGRHLGMDIHGITLFAFGGAAELHEEPATPRVEFLMAIAGPAMSVALAVLFHLLGLLLVAADVAEPVVTVLGYLSAINVLLAVFNLLPAFPLDGGRVLRAALWAWRGDVDWATRIASMVGGAFGLGLMLLGLLAALRGNLLGGVWWLLIGLFIRATAAASYQRLRMHHMLAGIPIRRLMRDEPIVVQPTASAAELVEDYLLGRSLKRVPVVENGRFIGHVGVEEVKALTPEERQRRLVGDIMVPAEPGNTIALHAGAAEALAQMQRTGHGRLYVVDSERLVGVLTLGDLLKYLSVAAELQDSTRLPGGTRGHAGPGAG